MILSFVIYDCLVFAYNFQQSIILQLEPFINSKLPEVGTTIFTEMSVLATRHQAINLGQGYPDFMMSEELISLVNDAMRKGHNQYVHMNGLQSLRENICQKIQELYGPVLNPDETITVTPGGTYAIYTALTTVLRPGDEVIVFEPGYDSYIPNIVVNGATPVVLQLSFPDYRIDWEMVKQKITPRTKMIMLNTPHNPTGAVLSDHDIEELKKIVEGTDLMILSDEQRQEIERFQQQKLEIRKELRQVRRNLLSDIDNLGTWLKVINVMLVPLLVALLALGVFVMRNRRRSAT